MSNKIEMLDIEFLSDTGLLYKINKEILQPLGLALARTVGFEINVIDRVVKYEEETPYNEYTIESNEEKLKEFLSNKEKFISEHLIKETSMEHILSVQFKILTESILIGSKEITEITKKLLLSMDIDEVELDSYIESMIESKDKKR